NELRKIGARNSRKRSSPSRSSPRKYAASMSMQEGNTIILRCHSGERGNEIAAAPFDLPGKLEFDKDAPHLPRWSVRQARKFVNRNRRRSQKLGHAGGDIGRRPYG